MLFARLYNVFYAIQENICCDCHFISYILSLSQLWPLLIDLYHCVVWSAHEWGRFDTYLPFIAAAYGFTNISHVHGCRNRIRRVGIKWNHRLEKVKSSCILVLYQLHEVDQLGRMRKVAIATFILLKAIFTVTFKAVVIIALSLLLSNPSSIASHHFPSWTILITVVGPVLVKLKKERKRKYFHFGAGSISFFWEE